MTLSLLQRDPSYDTITHYTSKESTDFFKLKERLIVLLKRSISMFILSMFIILSGCMNADDKELNEYIELIQKDVMESSEINESLQEYLNLIAEGKAEEGLGVLTSTTIPLYEDLLKEYKDLELKNEDVKDLNEQVLNILQLDLDKQNTLKRIFEEIIEDFQTTTIEVDFEDDIDSLTELTEEVYEAQVTLIEKLKYVSEEYRGLEIDEDLMDEELAVESPEAINEAYSFLILNFYVTISGEDLDINDLKNGTQSNNNTEEDVDAANSLLFKDQGNPHVVFDAEVTIDETFNLTGKSNLIEGSTVKLTSYQFGSENPYLNDEMIVDENGNFETEIELHEDSLTGLPLTLRLGYHPEAEHPDIHEIHGEEGENLEGPFAHKYTNIKRTRHGAFTYALIDFQREESAQFSVREWDRPDDYGDLDIWMKEENVDIHEDYYDITMTSNLNELSFTRTTIEIPGYDIAGYSARAYVDRDGSFRFQIPRIEDRDVEEKEDIIFVIDASSDSALETEELYGVHGENFEGDLVEKTKRGKKIQYKFNLHDAK